MSYNQYSERADEKFDSFCMWLDSSDDAVSSLIEEVFEKYLLEQTKQIRTHKVHKSAIKLFILNFATYRNESGQFIRKTRKISKSDLPKVNDPINAYRIGKRIFKDVHSFMVKHYIEEDLGNNKEMLITTLTSNLEFVKLLTKYDVGLSKVDRHSRQPIFLIKDIRGKFKRTKAHSLTKESHTFIKRYNELLSKTQLFHPHPDFQIFKPKMVRMFKPDLNHHGRFYGRWQQIPNKIGKSIREDFPDYKDHNPKNDCIRSLLTINGHPTTEIDFKACFPLMLYHMEGIGYHGDPYDLTDSGLSEQYPDKTELRQIAKLAFQCMINGRRAAQGAIKQIKEEQDRNFNAYPSLKVDKPQSKLQLVVDALGSKHQPISQHFKCEELPIGFKLMFIESQIAQAVMNHFLKQNILCLPIHDSFMMERKHKEELKETMIESYYKLLKHYPGVSIDY